LNVPLLSCNPYVRNCAGFPLGSPLRKGKDLEVEVAMKQLVMIAPWDDGAGKQVGNEPSISGRDGRGKILHGKKRLA